MEKKNLDIVTTLAEEYCQANDLFLVKIETGAGKISVYADSMNNITIEQCGKLSRYIQNKLEESTNILNDYTLDVSSPGMSNPLVLPIQYQKRLEKTLRVVDTQGAEIEGKVIRANEEGIELEIVIPKNKKTKEEEKIVIHKLNFNQIKKATIPLPTTFKKK